MAIETIKTTTIERGLANDRIHKGMGYTSPHGVVIHTTMRCSVPNDVTALILAPLYEEDGQLYAVNDEYEQRQVTMCEQCPKVLDLEWKTGATCRGSGVDMVSPPTDQIENLIKTFCDNCPVVVQCLEYGTNTLDNVGIWGGVFLPYRAGERKRLIESL